MKKLTYLFLSLMLAGFLMMTGCGSFGDDAKDSDSEPDSFAATDEMTVPDSGEDSHQSTEESQKPSQTTEGSDTENNGELTPGNSDGSYSKYY